MKNKEYDVFLGAYKTINDQINELDFEKRKEVLEKEIAELERKVEEKGLEYETPEERNIATKLFEEESREDISKINEKDVELMEIREKHTADLEERREKINDFKNHQQTIKENAEKVKNEKYAKVEEEYKAKEEGVLQEIDALKNKQEELKKQEEELAYDDKEILEKIELFSKGPASKENQAIIEKLMAEKEENEKLIEDAKKDLKKSRRELTTEIKNKKIEIMQLNTEKETAIEEVDKEYDEFLEKLAKIDNGEEVEIEMDESEPEPAQEEPVQEEPAQEEPKNEPELEEDEEEPELEEDEEEPGLEEDEEEPGLEEDEEEPGLEEDEIDDFEWADEEDEIDENNIFYFPLTKKEIGLIIDAAKEAGMSEEYLQELKEVLPRLEPGTYYAQPGVQGYDDPETAASYTYDFTNGIFQDGNNVFHLYKSLNKDLKPPVNKESEPEPKVNENKPKEEPKVNENKPKQEPKVNENKPKQEPKANENKSKVNAIKDDEVKKKFIEVTDKNKGQLKNVVTGEYKEEEDPMTEEDIQNINTISATINRKGAKLYYNDKKYKADVSQIKSYMNNRDFMIQNMGLILKGGEVPSKDEAVEIIEKELADSKTSLNSFIGMIDPSIIACAVNIYNDNKIDSKQAHKDAKDLLTRYVNAMRAIANDEKDLHITYDLKDLSKGPSLLNWIKGNFFKTDEKESIKDDAIIAEISGIAKIEGEFKPTWFDRFVSKLSKDKNTKKLEPGKESKDKEKEKEEMAEETKALSEEVNKILKEDNFKGSLRDENAAKESNKKREEPEQDEIDEDIKGIFDGLDLDLDKNKYKDKRIKGIFDDLDLDDEEQK